MTERRPWVIPVYLNQLADLEAIVDAYLMRDNKRDADNVQVAFYGGSFPSLDALERRRIYRRMKPLCANALTGGLRVTSDPADILPDVPRELADGGVRTVELNACSMDDDVLDRAGRTHTTADTMRAVDRLRTAGIDIGIRIHPGLPGSSSAEILETGNQVARLAPDFVRIYPILVLEDTWLAELYEQGRYRPLSLAETVSKCKRLVRMFQQADIPIARIGLQPAVDLPKRRRVVAGPYHPSLRFLVDAELAYDRACELITEEFRFARAITLAVPPREEAALRGEMGNNLRRLKQRFKLTELRIHPDSTLPSGTLRLEILDVPMAG